MPETTQSDLVACPFCANTKFQRNTKAKGYFLKKQLERERKPSSNHLIRCTRCGAKGPLSHSIEEAEATWNERPGESAELFRLRAHCEAMSRALETAERQITAAFGIIHPGNDDLLEGSLESIRRPLAAYRKEGTA